MSFDIAKQVLFDAWIDSFSAIPGQPSPAERAACWAWVNGRKLSQSEIRLEVALNTTNTNFVFAVTPQQTNTNNISLFPSEKRLALQDSLIAAEMGIFLALATSNTTPAQMLHTYGNPNVFTTGFTALDNTFYGPGYFEMKVNNDTIIPYRGLVNHYYRPQTQQIAPIAVGAVGDQFRGAEDGFITMEPNTLLIGSKNYVPQIVLPTALAAVDATTRAVLIFRGVLVQNSTVIN